MKSSQLTNILLGLTVCSALASVLLCWQTISRGRQIRQLQPQALQVQQLRERANTMLFELVEYSKKNPQIQPILQSLSAKPAATPAAH